METAFMPQSYGPSVLPELCSDNTACIYSCCKTQPVPFYATRLPLQAAIRKSSLQRMGGAKKVQNRGGFIVCWVQEWVVSVTHPVPPSWPQSAFQSPLKKWERMFLSVEGTPGTVPPPALQYALWCWGCNSQGEGIRLGRLIFYLIMPSSTISPDANNEPGRAHVKQFLGRGNHGRYCFSHRVKKCCTCKIISFNVSYLST